MASRSADKRRFRERFARDRESPRASRDDITTLAVADFSRQKMARLVVFILAALLGAVAAQGAQAAPPRLRLGFYWRSSSRNATAINPGLGAGLIRMAFHDCFVQGCDASVLLDPTPANPRRRSWAHPTSPAYVASTSSDAAKAALEKACPGVVSCADVVQFAARDAAFFLSGDKVFYNLPPGASTAAYPSRTRRSPSFPLVTNFKVKGLNVDDLVVLSGSHTVGRSHCSSLLRPDLLYVTLRHGRRLATVLKRQCPANPNFTDDPTVPMDGVTPAKLDNQYYKDVLKHKGDEEKGVERKFAKAMVKMSLIEIKNAANGEIRKNCHVVN
ncbi:hypothetical protein HU200_004140 [Digitaria exilis]|uniref:Peroxidase n=1 Tax=Digitaria exilis TaxID=1010633 RepID=A0A835FTV7_9POAL|nr:hypothetical protein HU200_004140 [Digitaria exilis]